MSNPIDCTISGLSLTIIGYDGQVTINMDNKNIFTNIGANCNLKLYNLSFVNGKGKYGSSSVINVLKDGSLIVDNCTFKDNQGYYAGQYTVFTRIFRLIIPYLLIMVEILLIQFMLLVFLLFQILYFMV